MKANEFIKEHGFQYTRNLVRDYPNHTHVTDDGRMFINENTCASHIKAQLNELVKMGDLKQLIESHKLIASRVGLDAAKHELIVLQKHLNNTFGWVTIITSEKIDRFKQAILDVESCR